MTAPKCAECNTGRVRRVTGADIYSHRRDLAHKVFWRCDCGAYVGCHPGTNTALGTCAGPKLREARGYVHSVVDPHWRKRGVNRSRVYRYMAEQLGITSAECHVGMFDIERCRAAYRIMKAAIFHPDETNEDPSHGL